MADLNKFLNNLQNYTQNMQTHRALANQPPPQPQEPKLQSRFLQETHLLEKKMNLAQAQEMQKNANALSSNKSTMDNLKMNTIISMDRAVFIKELMNLPTDMKDLMNAVQKMFEQVRQGQQLDSKAINLAQNINLSQISMMLAQNGKEAVSKLMLAMGDAAKYGIKDLSDIKETIKVINASVSLAGQKEPSKILKSLMLLYLPWVPLQEGVGFDLEIDTSDENNKNLDETSLVIFISTKNYGNVKAVLNLIPPNEVNVLISCDKGFPKKTLLEKLQSEKHSMKSSVIFEEKAVIKTAEDVKPQARISVSDNSNINPFLLLMSNLVIRYTIELDNQA